MQAIDKKLWRDFKRLWVQALAIAMVLACGVAILLTSLGMYRALDDTRKAYYERNRFADVFASARRVPESLLPEIAAIPGVWAVEARVSGIAILDIEGRVESAIGRILSLPEQDAPLLNVPLLRKGRYPSPEVTDEVMVNEPFAQAHGFEPGDVFHANLNGQKRPLTITGTALSPEFIYTIGPGALMPDDEGFGILWMSNRAAAAAFDMTGAFNDLSLKLSAGANSELVIERVDALLKPFGGLGAHDRSQQQSDSFLEAETLQLRSTALILPPVFFVVSAFLVSMVMGRIVALERNQIGLLKAIGYSNFEVCLHYLMLAGLVAVCGIVIGWVAGSWLAHGLARLYADFFTFPFLIFRVSPWVYAFSGAAALLSTTLGALRSALAAARLAPAVAMQPPAPPRFSHSVLDGALAALRLSQSARMVARSFLRWPLRSALTILGMALAVGVLIASTFMYDALDKIIDTAFYQSNRQDAVLMFAEDVPEKALIEVAHLPGTLQVEGQQFHAAVLRNGPLSKRVPIEARRPEADLSRIVDGDGRVLNPPEGGILMARRLARQLELGLGDTVEVEFLTGRRETFEMTVSGMLDQYFGLGAYVDLVYLNSLFRQTPQVTVANVSLDETQIEALHLAIKTLPELTGTVMMNDTRRSFEETIEENVLIMNTIYISIATLITIGVAYNGARIQLSERARELASLRILGFTRGEVSFILIAESLTLALLAQPLGWLIGAGIARAMTASFTSDLYAIPLVLEPSTFARASFFVLLAALGSVLVVRQRLDRLDLVSVMKTRE